MNCEKCGKPKSENLDYCPTCNAQENNNANNIVVKCQCGQKLEENWKFCPKCNAPINVEIITTNTELTKDNSQNYIIIFLISIAINFFLNSNVFFLIALITIVSGKINYPNNKAIKILFWLMMLYAIFLLIIIMWLLLVCGKGISSCPG